MNTTHARFEVYDAICGEIEVYKSKYDASWAAARHAPEHVGDGVVVMFADRMARRGSPEVWRHDGTLLFRRST